MESEGRNISFSPTKILFIPHLPPSLANWKTLKIHFSQFGDVRNVVLNPHNRSCTVSFNSVVDAKSAKADGCVWKGKSFEALYWNGSESAPILDPRATSSDGFGYSDIDFTWKDDGNDEFGVAEYKAVLPAAPVKLSTPKVTKETKVKGTRAATKERKERIPSADARRIKLNNEKIAKAKKSSSKEAVTERQKECKRRLKEMIELGKKKRGLDNVEPVEKEGSNSKSPVLSLKEMFSMLEKRDKIIRKSFVKSSNVKTAKTVVGTCPDMCPEKERVMREYRRLVAIYEMVPGTQRMDPSLAVKAYVRSSADQEEPLPHELRPEPVLSMTMSYLITKIMSLIEDPNVNVSEWYDFCWDRLRGIRKDIIQQQLCNLEIVKIIEQSARFHICCYDRLWGADPLVFDEKINTENLMNCLQSLRHMYEDLAKENIKCPNEAEFYAYMILLNMKTGDLMAQYQLFSEKLQKEERIQSVVKLYFAFNNSMYSQFFKLVKKSTYLNACLLQRYFYHVRVQALQAITRAYCPPNKGSSVPIRQMMNILKFDSVEDTKLFCEGHGLLMKDNGRDLILSRNDFFSPETKIKIKNSSSLVTGKRVPLFNAVIGNGECNLRSFKYHKVHSSFNDDGTLNEMAIDASDQKFKSDEFVVDISSDHDMDLQNYEDLEVMDKNDVDSFQMIDKADEVDYNSFSEPKKEFSDIGDEDEAMEISPMDVDSEVKTSVNVFKAFQPRSDESHGEKHPASPFRFSVKPFSNANENSDFDFFKNETKTEIIQESPTDSELLAIGVSVPFGSNLNATTNNAQSQFKFKIDLPTENKKISTSPKNVQHSFSFGDRLFMKSETILEDNKNNLRQKSPEQLIKDSSNAELVQDTNLTNKSATVGSTGFTFSLNQLEKNKATSSLFGNKIENDSLFDKKSNFLQEENIDLLKNKHRSFDTQKDVDSKLECSVRSHSDDKLSDVTAIEDLKETVTTNQISSQSNKYDYESEKREREKKMLKKQVEEKQAMIALKKDLRRRLKATAARYAIKKWKRKVEKIKNDRIEFPLLSSVPPDKHESIWGTTLNIKSFSNCSLLNRLREKQKCIKAATSILDDRLSTVVPYIGPKIAENISNNNNLKLNLKVFSIPLYWKLVVSIPFLKENKFFVDKFNIWLTKLFYKSNNAILGSVANEITSHNIPVYYCVHLLSGYDFHEEKDKLTSMSSLLFFTINGVEDTHGKYKRFKNLLTGDKNMKPISVALVNIGKENKDNDKNNNNKFIKMINEKIKKFKFYKFIAEYWSDFNSITNVIEFLTSNVDLSSNINADTLLSLFYKISEFLFNTVITAETISEEFCIALKNPNNIITFYNIFLSKLESIIISSDYKDYNVIPPEFKEFVKYFNKPYELPPTYISISKANRPKIVNAFSKLFLPKINPWPPNDESEILEIFSLYCESMNCSHLLPRIMRIVDLKDDFEEPFEYFCDNVPWVKVIDLILRFSIQDHRDEFSKIVIIYNDNDISNVCQIDHTFGFLQKILQ